jgi:hypothetical protein
MCAVKIVIVVREYLTAIAALSSRAEARRRVRL